MKKIYKVFFIFTLFCLITGCNQNKINLNTKCYDKININLKNNKKDDYLLFLIAPGTLPNSSEALPTIDYVGPIKGNDSFEIDLKYNWDLYQLLEKTDDNKLQVVITDSEDIYMLNPLNKDTFIDFDLNTDTSKENEYFSKVDKLSISVKDGYPKDVYSLHYKDANFVIKLDFVNGYDENSPIYEVGIKFDDNKINFLGMTTRPSKYYEVPFYKEDNLANKSGTIIVTNKATNKEVIYDDYPLKVKFDKDGNCNLGNLVKVKIDN